MTIGNLVWHDGNANGLQDSGEAGIPNVTLTLSGTDYLGNPVTDHATTNTNGIYLFTEAPGSYTVTVDAGNFTGSGALAGYTSSLILQGPDRTIDSNSNPSGTSPGILPAGGSDLTVDFGFYKPASIGDFVWHDMNANGIQDTGEPGIAGAVAKLYKDGVDTAMSYPILSDGFYQFTGLVPGNYSVQFILPGGYVFTGQDQGETTPRTPMPTQAQVSPGPTLWSAANTTTPLMPVLTSR